MTSTPPDFWQNRRIFITGGTGFIGANLVRRLHALGADLHLLVRQTSSWRRLSDLRPELHAHQVDLRNATDLCNLFSRLSPDCCFHLASYGSSSWDVNESTIVDVTCHGIGNLLNACRSGNCQTLVNAGTSSEYGLKEHAPSESEALTPNSVYAAAKAYATHRCQLAARSGDLHAPTARLYSVYGPWESRRRFIPALLLAATDNSWPPLVNPQVARDFVYVDDVVDCLLQLASRDDLPGDAIYNVGTGRQTTIGDAVALARKLCAVTAEPVWGSMPDRQWDTTCWIANSDKISNTLDWRPRDFATGLKLTADWLRQHPDWE